MTWLIHKSIFYKLTYITVKPPSSLNQVHGCEAHMPSHCAGAKAMEKYGTLNELAKLFGFDQIVFTAT